MLYIILYLVGMVLTFVANAYRLSRKPSHCRDVYSPNGFFIIFWPVGVSIFLILCFYALIGDLHDRLVNFFVTKQAAKAKPETTNDV